MQDYESDIKIAPSILAADFSRLGEEIAAMEKAGAAMIHIDVMDGIFVPNISIGVPVVESVRKATDMILDVHLMITEPVRYIETFAKAGADIITVHIEACRDIDKTIEKIKDCKVKAGISIKPGTSAEEVLPLLNKIDMILVMSVEPGFGGQKYISTANDKISFLRKHIDDLKLNVDIQVDGGINSETIREASRAGANVFVAGTAVFRSLNPAKTVGELIEIAKKAKMKEC